MEGTHIRYPDGTKQPVHSLLGGKAIGIQQGTSVHVGLPKSKASHLLQRNFSFEIILELWHFKDYAGHLVFSVLLDILAWEKDCSAKGIECE